MIIKILLSCILCFFAISPACSMPLEDDDSSGSESVSKRARVNPESENFLLEDIDFKDEDTHFTYVFPFDQCLLGAEEQGTLVTQDTITPILIPLRSHAIFRNAHPQFYNSAGESYGVPQDVVKKILSFIVDKRDIEALSLVSRGFCNWVDARYHLKVKTNIESNELLNLLRNKTDLRSIDLRGHCQLSDSDVENIVRLFPKLASIYLWECFQITDVGLQAIASGCPNLTRIEIYPDYEPKITDVGIRSIATHCKHMSFISVVGCDKVTDDGLRAIVENCPNLTEIEWWFSDSALKIIAENCPNLTRLDVTDCQEITDVGIKEIALKCQKLTFISINDCNYVTDVGLQALTSGCPNLTEIKYIFTDSALQLMAKRRLNLTKINISTIEISNGDYISDVGLEAIAECCPQLECFILQRCYDITDWGLKAIAAGCPELTSIDLENCWNITDVGLQAIINNCKKLAWIDLGGCKKVTVRGLDKFKGEVKR